MSTERIVADLLTPTQEKTNKGEKDGRLEVAVSDEFKSIYGVAVGFEKEYLGQSLLMALTFLRLCVIQCPESLKFLRKRNK